MIKNTQLYNTKISQIHSIIHKKLKILQIQLYNKMNNNPNVLLLENIDFFCAIAYNMDIYPYTKRGYDEGGKEMKISVSEAAKEEILKQNTKNKAIRIHAAGFG